jgi:hypothetical protein
LILSHHELFTSSKNSDEPEKEALERVTCTQNELARVVQKYFDFQVSQQSVSNILSDANISRKKVTIRVLEQFSKLERHVEFHEKLVSIPDERLVALDERKR